MLAGKKKYFDFNAFKNELFFSIIKNKKILLLSGMIFLFWSIFSIITKKNFYEDEIQISFCKLDGYVLMDHIVMKGLVLFPIAIYLFSTFLENTSLQFVVRKSTRIRLLKQEISKLNFLAFYLLILQVSSIVLTTHIICADTVNWTHTYTVFWYETGKILNTSPNYLHVLLLFLFNNYIEYIMLGLIYLLVGYCLNKKYLSYLIAVIFILLRLYFRDYIPTEGIWYSQWITWNNATFFYKGILIIGLYFICKKLILRKDFYCEN